MGLLITSDDEEPVPRRTRLTLECDRVSGFFCRGVQTFDEGGYVENRAAEARAGWLERHTSKGRIFICSNCEE
jgi:hypothetical protein